MFGFGQILNFLCPVEVEFWMDHDRVNGDLGRVELWRPFEKKLKQLSQSSICESLSSTKIHCWVLEVTSVFARPLIFETQSQAKMATILVLFYVLQRGIKIEKYSPKHEDIFRRKKISLG